MKHVIECRFSFSNFKKNFQKHEELSFIFKDNRLHFLAHKDGVSSHISFDAIAFSTTDIEGVQLGYTLETALLFKLVSVKDKDKVDECVITIYDSGIEFKVNDYSVTTDSLIFNSTLFNSVIHSFDQPHDFQLSDLYWLYSVGKNARTSMITVAPNWAFGRFGNVTYFQKRATTWPYKFSIPTILLSGFVQDSENKVLLGDALVLHRQDGMTYTAEIHLGDQSPLDEFLFSKRLKRYVKIDLDLRSHRELLKQIRGTSVNLSCRDKKIRVSSGTNESIVIEVKDLKIEYANTNFENMMELSDVVDSISFDDLNLLRVIANCTEPVKIFINRFSIVVIFETGRYAIIPLSKGVS